MSSARGSVAVLGGGMASLTAALALSEGDWRQRFDRITVYQRGWRLGGKGASSRGVHGRIEEHGLHVLLGYYHHTFQLLARCYEELDRPRTDPGCPILSWSDAVAPSNLAGVVDHHDGQWSPWVANFGARPGHPGAGGTPAGDLPLTLPRLAISSVSLLVDFFTSVAPAPPTGGVYLSTSPRPRAAAPDAGRTRIAAMLQGASLLGLTLTHSWAERALRLVDAAPPGAELARGLAQFVEPLRTSVRDAVAGDAAARRTHQLAELVVTNLVGIVNDGLLWRPDGFAAIDHLDYREWLSGHGIAPEALESPLLRGMYDLVFGYEGGDAERPRFSAGLGLRLATQMLLGYSGALFWKMQAGMGEVVFAPMYEVLRSRGVDFRFFHRVDALRLGPDGRSIASVELGVQAELRPDVEEYDPLVRVKGLPCWPSEPLDDQLRDGAVLSGVNLESMWSPQRDVGRRTLVAGEDFDMVVFGISLGMVPYVCADLVAASPAWQAMVDNVGTVATQSLQLWLHADERSLGWRAPDGATVSGHTKPFDTWASMSHLIPMEDWPADERPRTVAYFCGALASERPAGGGVDEERERADVKARAVRFLDESVQTLWPAAAGASGFRWDLLVGAAAGEPSGAEIGAYWRANVDPSDRYVQSLPGTDRFRLKPGETGFANLVIAGDWTDSGLNAGCVEAATLSGNLAAEAVLGSVASPRGAEAS